MSNYYNIGIVCSSKQEWLKKYGAIFDVFEDYNINYVMYPLDRKNIRWKKIDGNKNKITEYITMCYKAYLAEMSLNIKIYNFWFYNILIRIKHFDKHSSCLLFEIPSSENNVFDDLDKAEDIIIKFLTSLNNIGFFAAFCDCEADISSSIHTLNIDEKYSIFKNYQSNEGIQFAKWKIDGLTSRDL